MKTKLINSLIAFLGIVGTVFTIWGYYHPDTGYVQYFKDLNTKIVAIAAVIHPTTSIDPSSDSSITEALVSSTFIPMNTLASSGFGLQMLNAPIVTVSVTNSNQINFLLELKSLSKSAWKIYALNAGGNFSGWSVSSKSGAHCWLSSSDLKGIQVLGGYGGNEEGYIGHIVDMQTMAPGTILNASVIANCDRIYPTDTYYLSTQLHVLPDNTVEGPSSTIKLNVINFSSTGITVQQ